MCLNYEVTSMVHCHRPVMTCGSLCSKSITWHSRYDHCTVCDFTIDSGWLVKRSYSSDCTPMSCSFGVFKNFSIVAEWSTFKRLYNYSSGWLVCRSWSSECRCHSFSVFLSLSLSFFFFFYFSVMAKWSTFMWHIFHSIDQARCAVKDFTIVSFWLSECGAMFCSFGVFFSSFLLWQNGSLPLTPFHSMAKHHRSNVIV